MTGGVPSTAAVSAAAQAGNNAMQQGVDKVAELEQLAFQNYQTEGQNMYNAYAAMQGAEGDAWNRQMQEQQLQYQKEQDEYQKKLALAKLAASYGDYSGLKALGIKPNNYSAGGGGGGPYYTPKTPVDPEDDDDGNNAALAALLTAYPGKVLTASEWAAAAAQYGEQFLIDNGFSKKKPSGGGGGSSPGNGRDRVNMMI